MSFCFELLSETVVKFKDAFPVIENFWIFLRNEPNKHQENSLGMDSIWIVCVWSNFVHDSSGLNDFFS
jgi:hypothetical protein